MSAKFNEGDRVQIADRPATADDVKSGLFYDYFRGLTGTIQKLYATDEAALEIELESLDEKVANRHTDVQAAMKAKWLDGLSQEARERLTDEEKNFNLRYSLLVHSRDLTAPTAERLAPAPARVTSDALDAREEEELQKRRVGVSGE